MRRVSLILVLLAALGVPARADQAHDEMAAALEAQADLNPTPPSLPGTAAARAVIATTTAFQRAQAQRLAALTAARLAASAHLRHEAQRQAVAAQAHAMQSQAESAAGQAQAQKAKERAAHGPRSR